MGCTWHDWKFISSWMRYDICIIRTYMDSILQRLFVYSYHICSHNASVWIRVLINSIIQFLHHFFLKHGCFFHRSSFDHFMAFVLQFWVEQSSQGMSRHETREWRYYVRSVEKGGHLLCMPLHYHQTWSSADKYCRLYIFIPQMLTIIAIIM